jgi:hypothetical protein
MALLFMKRTKSNRRLLSKFNFGPFLLVMVMLFAVSAGVSFFFFRDKFAFESSFIADMEARQDKKAVEGPRKESGRLYGGGQEPDNQESGALRQDAQLVIAEDSIRKYIGPYKVRLLDLYMDNEGIIYVDLGDEIKRNFSGGAIEELHLITGLYQGIKAAVPGCAALKILIEGSEAESFGGHIDISRPIGGEAAENI